MAPLQSLLLVDDNEADNVYHRIVLEAHAIAEQVHTRQSPEEALAALLQGRCTPDLVLLDMNMPRLDGCRFAAKLQDGLPHGDWPALLMMSSSSLDEDRDQALALPIVRGYLTKPLEPEALRALLAQVLRPRG